MNSYVLQGIVSNFRQSTYQNKLGVQGEIAKFTLEATRQGGGKVYLFCHYWGTPVGIQDGSFIQLTSYCPTCTGYTDANNQKKYNWSMEIYDYKIHGKQGLERPINPDTQSIIESLKTKEFKKQAEQELQKMINEFDVDGAVEELEQELKETGDLPLPSIESINRANQNIPNFDGEETENAEFKPTAKEIQEKIKNFDY